MKRDTMRRTVRSIALRIVFGMCSVWCSWEQGFSQCTGDIAGNLITNGDFESALGSTASYSDYTYNASGGPGYWAVVSATTPPFRSYANPTNGGIAGDHTKQNSSGKFMVIDVDASSNKIAWKSTVTVQPNTTYYFSAWIANIHKRNTNPSQLQFAVNGTVISQTIIKPAAEGTGATSEEQEANADHSWIQFYTSWNSGSTTGPITVSMKNLLENSTGNDLALDDISFSTSCRFVQQLALSQLPEKFNVCDGSAVKLDSKITEAGTFTWTLGGSTVGTNATSYTTATLGTYIFCYKVNNCYRQDTVQLLNAPIQITVTPTSPTKCGEDGTLAISGLAPGTAYTVKYTYGGSPVTRNNETPNSKGIITLTGTPGAYTNIEVSAYGCTSNKVNATLTNPTALVIDLYQAITAVSCGSTRDIKIGGVNNDSWHTVYINGEEFQYQSNSSSTPYITIEDKVGGTYVIAVRDTITHCVSNFLTVDIPTTGVPTITVTYTDPSCGASDGTITVSGLVTGTKYDIDYKLNNVSQAKLIGQAAISPGKVVLTALAVGVYSDIKVALTTKTCFSNSQSATLAAVVIAAPTPVSGTTPVCTSTTLTVGNPPTGAAYYWQGTNANGTDVTKPATASYSVTTSGTYYVRAKSSTSNCWSASTSIDIVISAPPTITGTLTVCPGLTTTLTGSGTAATTNPWVSASTNIATVTSAGVVTGVAGGTSVLTYTNNIGCTATATVTVDALPTITGALTFCAGTTTTLTGSGTPAASNPWVSATTTTATVSNAGVVTGLGGGSAVITYTNNNGCVATTTVNVNQATTVKAQPLSKTVCVGQPISLFAAATGTSPFSYVWKRGSTIVGTNSTNLNIASAAITDAGDYTAEMTGPCGVITSNIAVVTVNIPPDITTQPQSGSDCAGGNVSMSVVATGTPAPTYQWQKGGIDIPGKTTASLSLSPLAASDAGSYTVKVTNTCTTITSAIATATVSLTVAPSVTLTISQDKLCGNGSPASAITLTAASTGGGNAPQYTFKESGTVIGTANQASSTYTYAVPANTGTTVQNLSFTVEMLSNSGCLAPGAINPAVSNALPAEVDPQVTTAHVNITETMAIVCSATRTLTAPAIPGAAYTSSWTTTNGASVTNGAVSGIVKNTTTLTTYKVESPLKLCPSMFDTVSTYRAGDLTNPDPVTASNNKVICATEAAPLLAGISPLQAGETGAWAVSGGTATVTATGQTANLQAGKNEFIYTISNPLSGCSADTALVTIVVEDPPGVTASDESFCSGASTNIVLTSATSGATFSWTVNAPAGISGANGGNSTPSNNKIVESLTSTLTGPAVVIYSITPKVANCLGLPFDVKVTVNPNPKVIATDASICSGAATSIALSSDVTAGVTYSWTGTGNGASTGTANPIAETLTNTTTAATNTTYSITATANTCTGPATVISVKVKPIPVTSGLHAPICSDDPISIALNHNITTPGVTSTYTWTASGSSANVTGYIASGTSNPIAGTLTNSASTAETVTYNVTPTVDGCPGNPTPVAVIVKPIPTVTASAQAAICGGNPINIALTSPVTGTTFDWTVTTAGSVTAPAPGGSGTPITQTLTNTGNTSNTATYLITPTASGCKGPRITPAVTVNPAPAALATGKAICSGTGTNVTITSNPAGAAFGWTSAVTSGTVSGRSATGGTGASIAETLINTGTSSAVVTYTITPTANGCPGAADTVVITVKPIPTATTVNSKPELCSGATAAILVSSATSTATFTITAAGGAGSSNIAPAPNPTTIAQILSATTKTKVTYTITPTAEGCPGLAITDTVIVQPIPVPEAGVDAGYCVGDSAFIGTAVSNPAYKYSWSPSTGLNNDTIAHPQTKAIATTTYTVMTILRANPNCKLSDDVKISVSPQFTVNAGPDQLICAKDPVTLTATPAGLESYVWSNGATTRTINLAPEDTALYIVTASNGACKTRDTVVVNVKNIGNPTLYIPNSFTPNDDNLNDIFKVSGEGVIEFEGMIFDRWGTMFYKWTEMSNGWDGKLPNGDRALQDVYIYFIKVKNLCDKKFGDPRSGTVTIIK